MLVWKACDRVRNNVAMVFVFRKRAFGFIYHGKVVPTRWQDNILTCEDALHGIGSVDSLKWRLSCSLLFCSFTSTWLVLSAGSRLPHHRRIRRKEISLKVKTKLDLTKRSFFIFLSEVKTAQTLIWVPQKFL